MQFTKVSEFVYSILSDLYGIQIVNHCCSQQQGRGPTGAKYGNKYPKISRVSLHLGLR